MQHRAPEGNHQLGAVLQDDDDYIARADARSLQRARITGPARQECAIRDRRVLAILQQVYRDAVGTLSVSALKDA